MNDINTFFNAYPPGTTGTFAVGKNGAVSVKVNPPAKKPTNKPEKKYWCLNIKRMPSYLVVDALRNCGAVWGFVSKDSDSVVFASRQTIHHATRRMAEIDIEQFEEAVITSGWYGNTYNPRIIDVRGVMQ